MTGPRAYHQVPVAEVVQEAGEACSLVLAVPPGLAGAFAYRPGQFLTVRVPDGAGGSVARCYSLSSSPHAGDAPAITVKRMTGGYASNWIADNVRPGTVLDLLPPAGMFSETPPEPSTSCQKSMRPISPSSQGSISTAPAPSPKMMQVVRSV